MWSLSSPSQKSPIHSLVPGEVLYWFDEPLVFTSRIGIADYVFVKIDESALGDIFLGAQCTARELFALKNGDLSIRGAIGHAEAYVFETKGDWKVSRFWETCVAEFSEAELPESGVGIDPEIEWCADSIEQVDSFFAVRLAGGELKSSTISLKDLRNFTSNFYDLVRDFISPLEFARRRDVITYEAYEPAFGSLIFSIKHPVINTEKIDVRDGEAASKELQRRRDELLKGLEWLDKLDLRGELDPNERFALIDLVEGINALLPDEEGKFAKLEISYNHGKALKHHVIDAEKASEYRARLAKIKAERVSITGMVEITNSRSNTFVVRASSGRQVTVTTDPGTFANLLFQGMSNGAKVTATGTYQRRERRDLLSADSVNLG